MLRQEGGTTLPVSAHSTSFTATLHDVCTTIKAFVVKDLHTNLLISWQDLIALHVINKNFPAQLNFFFSTQNRYATIELECIAIQFGISKCHFYLQGLPSFNIITDHKPLLGIFDKYIFEVDNPWLQRLREKNARFQLSN